LTNLWLRPSLFYDRQMHGRASGRPAVGAYTESTLWLDPRQPGLTCLKAYALTFHVHSFVYQALLNAESSLVITLPRWRKAFFTLRVGENKAASCSHHAHQNSLVRLISRISAKMVTVTKGRHGFFYRWLKIVQEWRACNPETAFWSMGIHSHRNLLRVSRGMFAPTSGE
jgi:hypothetical protein